MKDLFKNITPKQWKNIQIGTLVLSVILFIYFFGKNEGQEDAEKRELEVKAKKTPPIPLPNSGSGIPQGWNAGATATKLYVSMKGWGTDETAFFNAMNNLTKDQSAAVYNKFNDMYEKSTGYNLIEWIQGDFSGAALSRALSYFNEFY